MSSANSENRYEIAVGINLPQYDVDFAEGRVDTDRLLAYAISAEKLGYDGVWVSDHPYVVDSEGRVSGALDALALIGALAHVTTTIDVGTLVLAGTMLDVETIRRLDASLGLVCPGRGVLGIGAGWNPAIHNAFGIPLRDYRVRSAHLGALAETASAGDSRLLIGGWGPEVLDTAARYASKWNVAWDVPPQTFHALERDLTQRCRRLGRDPTTLRRSVGLTIAPGNQHDRRRSVDRLRTRVPMLHDRDSADLCGEIERRAIVGDSTACVDQIRAYRAQEVVLTPLLRDDTEMLGRIATEILPHLHRPS